jgi:hypothetical protein
MRQDHYGLSLVNLKSNIGYHYIPEKGLVSQSIYGAGLVMTDLSEYGKRFFERNEIPKVQYSNGPIFSPAYRSDFIPLATYSDEITTYDYQKGTMKNTPAIILAPYG